MFCMHGKYTPINVPSFVTWNKNMKQIYLKQQQRPTQSICLHVQSSYKPLSCYVLLSNNCLTFNICLTLSWRRFLCHHIETSPLVCRANQWTGFYMITASVMKELICFVIKSHLAISPFSNKTWPFLCHSKAAQLCDKTLPTL